MDSGALCDQMSLVGKSDLKLMEVLVENGWDQEKIAQLVGV